jgi:long-chain acyl-CoA synthetase
MTHMDAPLWQKSYPPNISWNQNVPVYPLFDMLEKTATQFGDRPAFDFLGAKWTWQDMYDQSLRMAKGLQAMGVGKGTKVGLFLPNCPIFVIAYYAIVRTGASVVNYNPLYSAKELAHQIEDSQTDIMVSADLTLLYDKMKQMLTDTRLNHLIVCHFPDLLPQPKRTLFKIFKGRELAKIPVSGRITHYHDLIDNDGRPAPVDIDPVNDVAVLQYTGGTTGIPKGAMLTHANVVANAEQATTWLGDGRPGEEKMVGVLPFFHVFAMTAVMNFSVKMGFEIVALPRFELIQTLKLIDRTKPHFFPGVPAIYNAINNCKKTHKFDLSSLRYCIAGGAPLPVEVKKSFEEKTGCVVVEGYGLTEATPVICCNPPVGENKAGSIGLPLPGTIVEIINPEDKTTRMPLGERGELCARGPQVMKGYWNNQEATNEVLRDGLLYTGDIAIMDEDGYVYIVDRIKDLIITNGYNVYPRNVEEAIYLHPCVEECIVAGLPDTQRGEIVKAWVKCKEGRELSIEDLKIFLKDKLSPMEMPKHIEFRSEPLPKTMIGKLSRKDIVAQELEK